MEYLIKWMRESLLKKGHKWGTNEAALSIHRFLLKQILELVKMSCFSIKNIIQVKESEKLLMQNNILVMKHNTITIPTHPRRELDKRSIIGNTLIYSNVFQSSVNAS